MCKCKDSTIFIEQIWSNVVQYGGDMSIAVSYTHLTLPTNREV